MTVAGFCAVLGVVLAAAGVVLTPAVSTHVKVARLAGLLLAAALILLLIAPNAQARSYPISHAQASREVKRVDEGFYSYSVAYAGTSYPHCPLGWAPTHMNCRADNEYDLSHPPEWTTSCYKAWNTRPHGHLRTHARKIALHWCGLPSYRARKGG